jgi:sigma-B regulation protein RsbU (phosphoserine phosphatase)
VLKDLTEFIGHNDQFDDITMLCLEYRGPSLHHKKVTLPADKSRIAEGIAPVLALLEESGADHKTIYKVELALDEVLTNVASYAYAPELGDVTIEYGILADEERTLQVSIIDSGKEFNPLQNEDPDTTLSAEERGIGGLGLFLVKKSMDEVTYRRKDEKNILTMKKKF